MAVADLALPAPMLVRDALGEAVAIAHTIRAILGTVLADALAVKWAKELTKAYDRSALVGEHVAEARAVGSGGASLVGRITALEVGAARMRLCQLDWPQRSHGCVLANAPVFAKRAEWHERRRHDGVRAGHPLLYVARRHEEDEDDEDKLAEVVAQVVACMGT